MYLIKRDKLWKGWANNFNEFLHQERINLSAARQYMRVAEKLYFDIGLTDHEFEALTDASMSTLEKACAVITHENKSEIIALVSTLDSRDARHEIDEMTTQSEHMDLRVTHPRVRRLLNTVFDLPHELRIEMLTSLNAIYSIDARCE